MSQAISTYWVAMDGDIIAQFELDGRLLGRVKGPREALMQLFANALYMSSSMNPVPGLNQKTSARRLSQE